MAQPPINKIKMGNLTATIWQNLDTREQPFYICTFSRSYTDAEGNWQEANSFSRSDLLSLAKLADQAHTRIEALIQQNRADAARASDPQQSLTTATSTRSHQR